MVNPSEKSLGFSDSLFYHDSFKLLMRVLRLFILYQLVLTTTSGFFVVNPSEKSLGFSDSLFYYDSNDI